MKTLSTLWTVMRSSPTALYYLFVVLRYLPAIITLTGKLQEVFGSEAMQELMKALHAFINRIAPPTPAAGGVIPVNTKQEKRRRLFQFRNRLEVAGILTDAEAQEFCAQHHFNPYEMA